MSSASAPLFIENRMRMRMRSRMAIDLLTSIPYVRVKKLCKHDGTYNRAYITKTVSYRLIVSWRNENKLKMSCTFTVNKSSDT